MNASFPVENVCTVRRDICPDDCLKLVRTSQDARKFVSELTDLLSHGGFCLTKWMSNLASDPKSERAKSVFNLDQDEIERTLGVQWNMNTNEFSLKVVTIEKLSNGCGISSLARSVYDPLGPISLSAKLILQELFK